MELERRLSRLYLEEFQNLKKIKPMAATPQNQATNQVQLLVRAGSDENSSRHSGGGQDLINTIVKSHSKEFDT